MEKEKKRRIIAVKRVASEVKAPAVTLEEKDEAPIREEYTRLTEMYAETRDELVGLLKSRIGIGNLVKEQMLFLSEQQQGIANAYRNMYRPRVPWNLLALTAIVVSIIVVVGANPQFLYELNVFFSNPQNALALIVVLLIVFGIVYLLVKRGAGKS